MNKMNKRNINLSKSRIIIDDEGFTVFYGRSFELERVFKTYDEAERFAYFNELNN